MANATEADFYGDDGAFLDQLLSTSRQPSKALSQRVTPRQIATVLMFNGPLGDGKGNIEAVENLLCQVLPPEASGIADPTKYRAPLPVGRAFVMPLGAKRIETLEHEQRRKRDEQRKPDVKAPDASSSHSIPHDQQFMLINLAGIEPKRDLLDDLNLLGSVGAKLMMKALGWTQAEKQASTPLQHHLSNSATDAPDINAQAQAICDRLGIEYNETRTKTALRAIIDRELHGIVNATDISAVFNKLDSRKELRGTGHSLYKVGPTIAHTLTRKDKGQRVTETALRMVNGSKPR